MKRFLAYGALISIPLLLLAGSVQAQEAKVGVEEGNRAFIAFFLAGDAQGIAQLYTADAEVIPPGAPIVRGRAAIGAFWKSFIDSTNRDCKGTAYNVTQAQTAIGSGGLAGKVPFKGTQTRLDLVPEQHTDFIFTAVGEELGFAGAGTLLALFAILSWRIWRTAQLARDDLGTLICVGVLCMLLFQIFENAGMTMGIMPITGIPLPFVSYGGSSTITAFASVGLVMNVHSRRFS